MKEITLTKEQMIHYRSIMWLISEGPRASGRTYLLAIAYISKAMMNPNMRVSVKDHGDCSDRNLMEQIKNILTDVKKLNDFSMMYTDSHSYIIHKRIKDYLCIKGSYSDV